MTLSSFAEEAYPAIGFTQAQEIRVSALDSAAIALAPLFAELARQPDEDLSPEGLTKLVVHTWIMAAELGRAYIEDGTVPGDSVPATPNAEIPDQDSPTTCPPGCTGNYPECPQA